MSIFFFELKATQTIAHVMSITKANSSKWINENKFLPGKFSWQDGYRAFSNSRSQRHQVSHYIMNQEVHHSKQSFQDEYLAMLKGYEIDYKERYLFEFFD